MVAFDLIHKRSLRLETRRNFDSRYKPTFRLEIQDEDPGCSHEVDNEFSTDRRRSVQGLICLDEIALSLAWTRSVEEVTQEIRLW